MMRMTQKEIIVKMLEENGRVTRNQCLAMYISRLGAIINSLKKEGWKFVSSYIKNPNGKDYEYKLVNQPK